MKSTLNINDGQNKKNIWDGIACFLFVAAVASVGGYGSMVGGILCTLTYVFLKIPVWGYVAQQEKQLQTELDKKIEDDKSLIRKEFSSIADEKSKLTQREKLIKNNEAESAKKIITNEEISSRKIITNEENSARRIKINEEESAKKIKTDKEKISKQIKENNERSKRIDDTVERKVQEKFHAYKEKIRDDLYQQEDSLLEQLDTLKAKIERDRLSIEESGRRIASLENQEKEITEDLARLRIQFQKEQEVLPSAMFVKVIDDNRRSYEQTRKDILELTKQNNKDMREMTMENNKSILDINMQSNQKLQEILRLEKRAQNQVLQNVSSTMQHAISEQRQMFSEQSQRSTAVIGGLAQVFNESTREFNKTTRKVLETHEKVTESANETYTRNNRQRDTHDENMRSLKNERKKVKSEHHLERQKLEGQEKIETKKLKYQKEMFDKYADRHLNSVPRDSVFSRSTNKSSSLQIGYDSDEERSSSFNPRGRAPEYDLD